MNLNLSKERIKDIIFYVAILFGLYLMTGNFLLFHAYAEIFSIIVAGLMFVITWNARKYIDNYYLFFVGLTYLFVGNLDLLHTLGFKGMNIFPDYSYYANQLWVVARLMEALSLLVGFYYLKHNKKCNEWIVLGVYTLISAFFILVILVWKIFPEAFVEGVGQTSFKVYSEILIIIILVFVLLGLRKFKSSFTTKMYHMLSISVVMTIISEVFFTVYIDNYDISNILGHYFKIVSFILIYKSIVEKGISEPYSVIFNKLSIKNDQLKEANETKLKILSVIAHDLKSPFSGILTTSSFLVEEHSRLDDEERGEFIRALDKSSKETYELLSRLLDWARANMENLGLDFKPYKIKELLDNAILAHYNLLKTKEIIIHTFGDDEVLALINPETIEIAIRNALSNAIKYSHPRGRIDVFLSRNGGFCTLEIRDYGVGMSKERLIEVSSSTTNSSTQGTMKEKGTGLGINIIREFVKGNNGEISITSQVDKGTSIVIKIPAYIQV